MCYGHFDPEHLSFAFLPDGRAGIRRWRSCVETTAPLRVQTLAKDNDVVRTLGLLTFHLPSRASCTMGSCSLRAIGPLALPAFLDVGNRGRWSEITRGW